MPFTRIAPLRATLPVLCFFSAAVATAGPAPMHMLPAAAPSGLHLAQFSVGGVEIDTNDIAGSVDRLSRENETVGRLVDRYGDQAEQIARDFADDPLGTASRLSADLQASGILTGFLSSRIDEVGDDCGRLSDVYRAGCVQAELEDLSRRLPKRGDYAEARAALDDVTAELDRIVRANRDRSRPRVSLKVRREGESAARQSQPFSAVRASSVDAANAQAARAIEEAKVRLLRSVRKSDPRHVHYQRIAAAVCRRRCCLLP